MTTKTIKLLKNYLALIACTGLFAGDVESHPAAFEQQIEQFLSLEKSADAALENGFQYENEWDDDYRKFNFFNEISHQYEEAISLALSKSQYTDALRIMEKLASLYGEKMDMPFVAMNRLLTAWKLCIQTNDLKKSEDILTKLHLLTDQHVSNSRAEEETDCCSSINLITALLCQAEILEITNSTRAIQPIYQEAGQLCMLLHEEGVSLGHLNPALIAGLCFEKSAETEKQAQIAYEKAIESLNAFDMPAPAPIKLIFGAPFYLHISLASLKSERKDVFAAAIHKQVQLYVSFLQEEVSNHTITSGAIGQISDYIKALVSVGYTLLGPQSPEMIEIRETLKNSYPQFDTEIPSSTRHRYEASLLTLFTTPKQTPVYEIVRQLEDNKQFLGP